MKKHDFFYIGLFVVIVGIFFYQTLLFGKLPIPSDALVGLYYPWRDAYASTNPRGVPFKNFLTTDPVLQQIPWRKIAIDQWKKGEVPRWNSYSFSGTPLTANIQAGVFYPLNILFFLLPFPWAWTVLIILEPLLAGLLLYIYLRHLRLDMVPSFFGALIWSFSGFSIAWLTWGTMLHVALWLPLLLLAIDKLFSHASTIPWTAVLVIVLTSQFLAGHIQISVYIMIGAGVYTLWILYHQKSKQPVVRLLLSIVIFLIISSIQWIPFLQVFKESARLVDLSAWQQEGWFLPWQHLVQFIAPDFFGNPTTLNYWGVWNYGELIGYIGIAPLVFALYALLARPQHIAKFWSILFLLGLLFLLPTPIAKIPYQLQLPIISSLQPTRLMVIVDFCLVFLAAMGLDRWLKQRDKNIWIAIGSIALTLFIAWIIVLSRNFWASDAIKIGLVTSQRNLYLPSGLFVAVSVLIGFAQLQHKKKIVWIICVLGIVGATGFDLLRFGWKFTPFVSSLYFFPSTKTIEFLGKQEKPFRVMNGDRRVFPPNVLSYYGIETIEGYDPIYSARYEEFIAASERGNGDIAPPFGFNRIITPHNLDSPLLPFLNIGYIISLTDLDKPFLQKVFQEGETRVYEYSKFLPRTFFVEETIFISDKQKIIDTLFQEAFDPKKTAITEEQLDFHVTSSPMDIVRIASYDVSSMTLDTVTRSDRFLVVSNIYYPGWTATIDGEKTKIFRTNFLFQGMVVPAGTHRIILFYR